MTTEVCGGCETRFAVGLLRCPRCGRVAPSYASRVRPAVVELRGEHGPEVALPAGGAHVDLTFRQLRTIAKSRGLSGGGTAAELAARISAHDRAEGGAP